MKINILTPDKTIFSGTATLVQLPGIDGLFEILENHAALLAALGKGKIKVHSEGETLFFEINSGVVEVLKNKVEVLAE